MSLCIGIVGLPNVGKSTLFQAITKKQVDRSNYPFCTIDPNIGVVAVPDERVDKLAELTRSAKKIYNTIEFVDIAGLIKGASKGEGLGNKFLANIREVDAIIYVLRCFQKKDIINSGSEEDIIKDKEIIDTELALKDLETTGKRILSLKKESRSADNKEAVKELNVLERAHGFLEKGELLVEQAWEKDEKKILKNYQLLTIKPKLFLLNGKKDEIPDNIMERFKGDARQFLIMDILTEFDAASFALEERESFGLPKELKIDLLIKEAYKLLNLITFLTTGPDETRAWTLAKGAGAPKAGGVIHSDFEKCFIKAEVINWQDLVDAGGFAQAGKKGLVRTEGKEYVVQDGDVIEIKSGA